jgi:endonuclease/exonuclease/phosphatase family metal-dependent hydrolase
MILASMNLHGGRRADGTPFDVVTACRQLQADMIVLQEAWWPAGRPDAVAEAAHALGHRILRADLVAGTDLRSLGIAADASHGQWGLGRTPGERMSRAAQLVTVTTPAGASLRVVNTHLTYRLFSPVQLVRLTRRLAAGTAPTVIAGDLNMPGPVSGLAVGYSPAVHGPTFPAHRPLLQLDQMLTSRGVRAGDGRVLPPAGSDHLPIRACLRVV